MAKNGQRSNREAKKPKAAKKPAAVSQSPFVKPAAAAPPPKKAK